MFRRQRQTVQPSFLSRCNISRILLNHIKQQTHPCTGTRTPRSRYWVNITFQVTSHVCRPTPQPTVETAPPCQFLRQKTTPAPRFRIRAHVPPFWGRMAQKAPQTNTPQGCVILRTCLSNNNDRVPGSLAGSLARSLDLTYCSSRFVKKGQLEYRCKLRISVLVFRAWWALIGLAGWRCKLGGERVRAKRSDIRRCVSFLFWGMTEGMAKQSNGINGKKALCGYSSRKGKFMRARGY
jgi:hypothetical protein